MFNRNQPRNKDGEWTDGASGSRSKGNRKVADHVKKKHKQAEEGHKSVVGGAAKGAAIGAAAGAAVGALALRQFGGARIGAKLGGLAGAKAGVTIGAISRVVSNSRKGKKK